MHLNYLLLFSLFFCGTLSGQDLSNLKHEVEKMIEFEYDLDIEEEEGLWIGVIDGDSTFIFSIGNMLADSLIEFQLGSVSKVFTYQIVRQELAKNGIAFQNKIQNYLGLTEAYSQITFNQLISHQSNLPREPYFFGKRSTNPENPYELYTDGLIVPELNKYSSYYDQRKEMNFSYGHLNYALLGLAIESISEKTYCELVKEKYEYLYPSIQCSDQAKNLINGYDKSGFQTSAWVFPGFASSEGLSANILDLTYFVRWEMKKPKSNLEKIKISKNLSFQAPWYVLSPRRSENIYSFSGTTSIHSVFVCFDKENETAVVMMRNSGKGILHLPLAILNMVNTSKAKSK